MLNYSYTNYGDIVNNTEIITVYNDKVYHIIFSADESRYAQDVLDASQMIKIFEIFSLVPYENIDARVRIEYPSDWNNMTDRRNPSFRLAHPINSTYNHYIYPQVYMNVYYLPNGVNSLNEYLNI